MKTSNPQPRPKGSSGPPLTPQLLAEVACRLGAHSTEEPRSLVLRALAIWKAAEEELATSAPTAGPVDMSFAGLASRGVVLSTRGKTDVVRSSNGVEKAVRRFFEEVLEDYDVAMKGRLLEGDNFRQNKLALKKLRDDVLQRRELSEELLAELQRFQTTARTKNEFAVTPELIRTLLPGIDVGQPGFEL